MNKHAPPPNERSSRSDDGGDSGVQELPPRQRGETEAPKPQPQAEKPQAEKPQADQPQNDRPQTDQPQTRKAEAETKAPAREAAEAGPFSRASWTKRRLMTAGIFAAIVIGVILWWPWGGGQPKVVYNFVKASRGDVVVSVRSTGSLEPRNPVDVIAPAGGRVESVAVKSGDRVMKGQSLARLVSDTARADLLSAQAELAARQADLQRAEADVAEARAALARARAESKLGAVETAEARLARVLANANEASVLVRTAQANVASAAAKIASLDIRAPFAGHVLKVNLDLSREVRAVTRGQSLFTMVNDLSQMNVKGDFPENALGSLHVGERAEFTAAAFPKRAFAATLTALDLWPKKQSKDDKEIVTYTGTLTGRNPDDLLRPGMSATIAVVIAEAKNALTVPNTALSFSPPPRIESRFPPPPQSPPPTHIGRVWVLVNGNPEPRDIELGLSDDRVTQVVSGPLREGEEVITSAFVPASR
jgi:HlyD family secretion protein